MKPFIKNFVSALPLALGALLTLFSVVYGMEANSSDNWASLFLGLIGIPTLYASILNISKE